MLPWPISHVARFIVANFSFDPFHPGLFYRRPFHSDSFYYGPTYLQSSTYLEQIYPSGF